MTGRIVKIISNLYTVESNNQRFNCHSRGRFRNDKTTPLVGDMVTFDEQNNYILEIHHRKNELVRPPVSNIDQAMIIMSVKNPTFSPLTLDKFIAIISFNNIKPVICFTKIDLLSKQELKEIKTYMKYYKKIGYPVITNQQLFSIKRILKNKITVLAGQSGVGKSTLLNKLQRDLNIPTGEISIALKSGKHTTRHVELYKMYNGYVCDTPGFTSLDLIKMNNLDIKNNFIEFSSHKCQYQDCRHLKEEGCYIKKQVEQGKIIPSRYKSYEKLIEKQVI